MAARRRRKVVRLRANYIRRPPFDPDAGPVDDHNVIFLDDVLERERKARMQMRRKSSSLIADHAT